MIKPGDIGFGGKRKGFYPNAVRFFTKSRWSHCFVVMPPYLGNICVLEADLKVQLVTFQKEYVEKNADYYEIWRPIAATEDEIIAACEKTFRENTGEIYGFLQIPWFAIRSILSHLGISLSKNWFPSGEICSETQWEQFMNLGREYAKAFGIFSENECSPEDLYGVMKSRLDLFEFIGKRD